MTSNYTRRHSPPRRPQDTRLEKSHNFLEQSIPDVCWRKSPTPAADFGKIRHKHGQSG